MSNYDPRNRKRALLAAILVIIGLGLLITFCSPHKDESSSKDDRSAAATSAPIASRDKSVDAPQRPMQAYPKVTCQDLAITDDLRYYGGVDTKTSLARIMLGGNSAPSAKKLYEDVCEYQPVGGKHRDIVAQTSYQVYTQLGIGTIYKAFFTDQVDSVYTTKIPASELPEGVDDGYYFTPAAMPADVASIYRNSGATLRVDNQTATVSLRGFNKLSPNVKERFMHNAVVGLVDSE